MKFTNRGNQRLEILLIEDDSDFRDQVGKLLGVYNDISQASSLADAKRLLQAKTKRFDVVLLDKNLPDGDGLSIIPDIKALSQQTVVIVLTGDSNFNLVQKCLEAGASDYLYKSENIVPDLLVRIPMAMGRAALEIRSASLIDRLKDSFRYEIVGHSPATVELRSVVQSLKGSSTSVLITGESGTGKELIAQRLHAIEDRSEVRPFETLNCGAIPENLVESELFGHARGAFTGAMQAKVGKFKLADGGDIFLDEVAELPMATQIKLLRVLQEGEFSPVGDNTVHRVNVRVIAATNRSLEDLVAEGKFRSDLYFRLAVFPIQTTPLRERLEDIPDLVRFFLPKIADSRFEATPEATRYLQKQLWPGNIRELRNVIERAVINAKRRGSFALEKSDIQISSQATIQRQSPTSLPRHITDISPMAYKTYLETMERDYLRTVVTLFKGNLNEAAQPLGISRSTLFRRLADLGLTEKESYRPGLRLKIRNPHAEVAHHEA
jgi:two-component system response regulator AtoC